MIIDKLFQKVKEEGHVCVGLDTSLDYIPESFKQKFTSIEDIVFNFNKAIIDATYDVVACYKVQIAYYEALGIEGLLAYKKTLKYIKSKNCISIADIKRGDIANTAKMYAKAHFEGDFESDFITLSPYMGMDSITPYLPYLKDKNKGIFVLVRTSNEGSKDIEYIDSCNNKKVYNIVGEKVTSIGKDFIGQCGYSCVGGVIGCTHVDEALEIRKKLKNMFFLIPGYGAQGGTAKDVAKYLNEVNGGVVNSSRGILLAYKKDSNEDKFYECSRKEAICMRDDILNATKTI